MEASLAELAAAGDGTVLVVGDSLAHQLYDTLECNTRRAAGSVRHEFALSYYLGAPETVHAGLRDTLAVPGLIRLGTATACSAAAACCSRARVAPHLTQSVPP